MTSNPALMSTSLVRIVVTQLQSGSVHNQESHPLLDGEFQLIGEIAATTEERFDDGEPRQISAQDAKDRLQACLREVLRDTLGTCHEGDVADVKHLIQQIESECPYFQGGIKLTHLDGTEDVYAWEVGR